MAPTHKRLLLIAYVFPPTGGAGVQRPLKFTKYLGSFGWDVTVLTPSNPSVPARDESLLEEIPAGVTVLRARTLEPNYSTKRAVTGKPGRRRLIATLARLLLQPDPQVLWLPAAYRTAAAALRTGKYDAILVTAPPFSSLLLGALLRLRFAVPLVFDYRDEWSCQQYFEGGQRNRFGTLLQEWMQRFVLRRADGVIATTPIVAEDLESQARKLARRPLVRCIYNGYDEADFTAARDVPNPLPKRAGIFRITYAGTLWKLNSAAPLVEAVAFLRRKRPELVAKLEVVLAGRATPEESQWTAKLEALGCKAVQPGYFDHLSTISLLTSSDALCLILGEMPGAERWIPGKLFEYLAARRPLLAITPRGEATTIIAKVSGEGFFSATDVAGIAGWLEQRLDARKRKGAGASSTVTAYSRERLAGELAAMLDELARGEAALAPRDQAKARARR